jgi:hypothetical protein
MHAGPGIELHTGQALPSGSIKISLVVSPMRQNAAARGDPAKRLRVLGAHPHQEVGQNVTLLHRLQSLERAHHQGQVPHPCRGGATR